MHDDPHLGIERDTGDDPRQERELINDVIVDRYRHMKDLCRARINDRELERKMRHRSICHFAIRIQEVAKHVGIHRR